MAQKIDPVRLRRMVAEGKTLNEVAEFFGVSYSSIHRCCERHDISKGVFRAKPLGDPKPAPEPADDGDLQKRQLINTGGRYADLAIWAGHWGVSLTHARILWGRLGLGLVPNAPKTTPKSRDRGH